MQQTRLSRRWLIKIAIFIVAATGLGLWGLFDATLAYPERGRAHAEYMEYQYMIAMGQAGLPQVSVPDPAAELDRLRADHDNLEQRRAEAESRGQNLEMMRANAGLVKQSWLESLKLVGDLDPEHTVIENPNDRFRELNAVWESKDQPKPLSGFDIPMQWAFVVIGFGFAAYLLLLILKVSAKKYKWEPETMMLMYPGGATVTPSEIENIDKRKWDEFIVQIKSGGKWRKLDLLRYEPLEAWFETMERETPFYEPPSEEPAMAGADAEAGHDSDGAGAPDDEA